MATAFQPASLVFGSIESWGRRLVVDFGFEGLVNKHEEYFGARWTKCVLFCVGLSVIATAASVVYNFIIAPIVEIVARISGNPAAWTDGGQTIAILVAVSLGSAGGIALANRMIIKTRLPLYIERAEAAIEEANAMTDKTVEMYAISEALVAELQKAVDRATLPAESRRDG